MPSEKSVDHFIESSSRLLQANPTATTLSITYANALKKSKKAAAAPAAEAESKKATNIVTFKCYEPRSGKCIKYSTYKVKELSRLLTFVGPRGVSVTTSKKRRAADDAAASADVASKKTKPETATATEHRAGLASIMSNVKFEEESARVATPQPEEAAAGSHTAAASAGTAASAGQPAPSASSKNKKKKKKGKK